MTFPDILSYNSARLINPSSISLVLGRNGAGKSRFLRELETLRSHDGYFVQYISPERAGTFQSDANVETQSSTNRNWIEDRRKRNQAWEFKQGSAARLKRLAARFAIQLESDLALRSDFSKTFVTERLGKINYLLANIALERNGEEGFYFVGGDGQPLPPESISSGESEAVTLGTEILYFFELCQPDKVNLLLLDEPDVHLHPDLQSRVARFLLREIDSLPDNIRESTVVCVATHSNPLVCELARHPSCRIGTKHFGSDEVVQRPISTELRKMAPFFGHPLSRSIADDTPLIIEGEDDERVWQQAARSAQGKIRVFPILATTVAQQTELETVCDSYMRSIYDAPQALSLRDGDGVKGALSAIGCVKRFRLQCYAAENLLVTDDVLVSLGATWDKLVEEIDKWCTGNPAHKDLAALKALAASKDRCRDTKIKDIRQLIPAILGSKKPWEVVVGQTLGQLAPDKINASSSHSIVEYVGQEALSAIGVLQEPARRFKSSACL